MSKSVFTGAHQHLVHTLVAARKRVGLRQVEVAERMGKDQSYISLIENSQRRVDALEFYAYARALGIDPVALYAEVVSKLDDKIDV